MSIRLPRLLKLVLLGAAGLLAAAVVGLVVLVNTIDFNRYAKLAADEVRAATGRELRIAGNAAPKLRKR